MHDGGCLNDHVCAPNTDTSEPRATRERLWVGKSPMRDGGKSASRDSSFPASGVDKEVSKTRTTEGGSDSSTCVVYTVDCSHVYTHVQSTRSMSSTQTTPPSGHACVLCVFTIYSCIYYFYLHHLPPVRSGPHYTRVTNNKVRYNLSHPGTLCGTVDHPASRRDGDAARRIQRSAATAELARSPPLPYPLGRLVSMVQGRVRRGRRNGRLGGRRGGRDGGRADGRGTGAACRARAREARVVFWVGGVAHTAPRGGHLGGRLDRRGSANLRRRRQLLEACCFHGGIVQCPCVMMIIVWLRRPTRREAKP